jgi:hypothetical protein
MPILQRLRSPRLTPGSSPAFPLDGQALQASFQVPAVKNDKGNLAVPFTHARAQFPLIATHDEDDPLPGFAHRLSRC